MATIKIKKSKQGSLRKALGTKEGEKIPASKLKVKSTDSPAMKKKKIFAQNARKWKHQYGGDEEDYVLAEKGEVYRDLDGNLHRISDDAPSHDDKEGGIEIPNVDSVLSDSYSQVSKGSRKNTKAEKIVRLDKEQLNSLSASLGLNYKTKKPISPAKAFIELQQNRDKIQKKYLGKIPDESIDKFSDTSRRLNLKYSQALPSDNDIYESLLAIQEDNKSIDPEALTNNEAQFGFPNPTPYDPDYFNYQIQPLREGKLYDSEGLVAARRGSQFVRDWLKTRWQTGAFGSSPGDIVRGYTIPDAVPDNNAIDEANKTGGRNLAGFYTDADKVARIKYDPNYPVFSESIATHETTHAYQKGNNAFLEPFPRDYPLRPSNHPFEYIDNKIMDARRQGKIKIEEFNDFQKYLAEPQEIHSRLMEIRKNLGFSPTQPITEETINQSLNNHTIGENYLRGRNTLNELRSIMPKETLIDLLNNVVSNDKKLNKTYAQYGRNRKVRDYAAEEKANMKLMEKQSGNFIRNWYKNRWVSGVEGTSPGDMVTALTVPDPMVLDISEFGDAMAYTTLPPYEIFDDPFVSGFANDQGANVRASIASDDITRATGVHETNHVYQYKNSTLNNPLSKAYTPVQKLNFTTPKNKEGKDWTDYDKYARTPEEVHSRLMEIRNALKLSPNETVTPKLLEERRNKASKGNKYIYDSTLDYFKPYYSKDAVVDLLNTVASNDVNTDNNYAKYGMKNCQYGEIDDVSLQGYRYDSPYQDESQLLINGDTIDMSATPYDLNLVPVKNGVPLFHLGVDASAWDQNPYSFDADQVLEIPKVQYGKNPDKAAIVVGGKKYTLTRNGDNDYYTDSSGKHWVYDPEQRKFFNLGKTKQNTDRLNYENPVTGKQPYLPSIGKPNGVIKEGNGKNTPIFAKGDEFIDDKGNKVSKPKIQKKLNNNEAAVDNYTANRLVELKTIDTPSEIKRSPTIRKQPVNIDTDKFRAEFPERVTKRLNEDQAIQKAKIANTNNRVKYDFSSPEIDLATNATLADSYMNVPALRQRVNILPARQKYVNPDAYINQITAQRNATMANINVNSTTGKAVAAQIDANIARQTANIMNEVNRINNQIDYQNETNYVNAANQETLMNNQLDRQFYNDNVDSIENARAQRLTTLNQWAANAQNKRRFKNNLLLNSIYAPNFFDVTDLESIGNRNNKEVRIF